MQKDDRQTNRKTEVKVISRNASERRSGGRRFWPRGFRLWK